MEQIRGVIEQVNDAQSMRAVAVEEQSATAAESTSSTAADLARNASDLLSLVGRFRV